MSGFDQLSRHLEVLRDEGMYRQRRVLESPQGRLVKIDGRALINFCSNDYLGLASDSRVRAAFKDGIDRWGVGSGASHLVCGHAGIHHELEAALAEFVGRPKALLFANGYAANLGVINALLGRDDAVYQDRLNHASLLDGGWISRAKFYWYRHADAADLGRKLAAAEVSAQRKLVVTDGTFSMDGDLCPLEDLVAVTQAEQAWLMVDDAHGFGVQGQSGCGLVDPSRYSTQDVPILMATLGKALGCFGAFVAGDEELIDTLVQRSRNYIFTTALPPAMAAATLRSLALVQEEAWRREHVAGLITRFRQAAESLAVDLLPSNTPIQPLIIGAPQRALALSQSLEDKGILVAAIRPPTVPKGTARLRITLTAAHTPQDVDQLLAALAAALTELEITA